MKQIKEKPESIKGLKEHIRATPKEVLGKKFDVSEADKVFTCMEHGR